MRSKRYPIFVTFPNVLNAHPVAAHNTSIYLTSPHSIVPMAVPVSPFAARAQSHIDYYVGRIKLPVFETRCLVEQ